MKRLSAALALALALAAGCGKDGPERAVVRGRVTYQGQPVAHGHIRFLPEEGAIAPPTGAVITDGRYSADAQGGVPVGTHRVEIEAFRAAPKPGDDVDVNVPPPPQYLPPRFNRASELQLTVPAGGGAITKDFDLTD
jgi:hypothetical protein